MSKKNELHRKLNEDGIFWKIESPGDKFPGKLISVGNHIKFTTSPIFEAPAKSGFRQVRVLHTEVRCL
ncbi:MAG: hypothetical protein QOE55_1864 [Acidobacteriaceae bacterium]|nr:hypothetical protein [Acidobacteriaceae bacterium]